MGYRNIVAAGTHSRAAAAASSRGRKCGAVLQYYVVSKYVVHKLGNNGQRQPFSLVEINETYGK